MSTDSDGAAKGLSTPRTECVLGLKVRPLLVGVVEYSAIPQYKSGHQSGGSAGRRGVSQIRKTLRAKPSGTG